MNKIGLNIIADGTYNRDKVLRFLQETRPSANLVLGNTTLVREIAELLPESIVIHRLWPDDDASRYTTPQERWNSLSANAPNLPNVYLYTQNEPNATAITTDWEIEMIRISEREGRGVVVGNFGYGGPEDDEWEYHLLPLLREIAATNARRRTANLPLAVLGLHEYFDFHNWRFKGEWKRADGTVEYWNVDPLEGNNWLIGRFQRMFAICDKYGIPHPPIIITEHGSDSNRSDDWHGWLAGVGLSIEEYAAQLIDMARLVYNVPEIIGVCIFEWGGTNWQTFNVEHADALHEILINYARNVKPMEKMLVTVTQAVSRRTSPGGTLLQGQFEPVEDFEMEVGPRIDSKIAGSTNATVYAWREFRVGENAWFSATGPASDPDVWITLEPVPVVEPPPPPEPTEPPVVSTEDLLNFYNRLLVVLRSYEGLMDVVQSQAALAKNYTQEFADEVVTLISNLASKT